MDARSDHFLEQESLRARYASGGKKKKREPKLCDGCNIRVPWEHRCHGQMAVVRGEQTGFPCECARPECKKHGSRPPEGTPDEISPGGVKLVRCSRCKRLVMEGEGCDCCVDM